MGKGYSEEINNRWALIIAIQEYAESAEMEPLNYPQADSEAIKVMLNETWSVPQENIFTLYNQEATFDNIKKAVTETLASKAQENDLVIIYYNGHGQDTFPDFDGDEKDGSDECIIPYDCEVNYPKSYISDDKFTGWLQKIKGNLFLIMEFDGGYGMADFESANDLEGRTAIMSPYIMGQLRDGDPSLNHNVLTYYLLERNTELYNKYKEKIEKGDEKAEDLTIWTVLEDTSAKMNKYLENKSKGFLALKGKLDLKGIFILKKP